MTSSLQSSTSNTTSSAPTPAPFSNPYLAGAALGVVLLVTYVVMGRGLGASGAIASLVSWAVSLVAPDHANANEYFAGYLEGGAGHPLLAWLVFEALGVLAGGLLSGWLAHRLVRRVEKGPRTGSRARLALALGGGALTAFGARLGRGCTSGQALSGGALLNAGSWVFMLMVFAGGYATAAFARRQWR